MIRARNLTAILNSALLLFGLAWLATPALAAPAAKVDVCHIPPGNPDNFHTIRISENALAAHLAHGDFAGACGDFCETLCDDGNACTADACDAAEQCIHPPVDCNDTNVCTADSCDAATGCEYVPLPDTACTVDDTNPCTEEAGVCNPSGVCDAVPVPECCNTTSDCQGADEDLCTIEECVANSCTTVEDVVCATDACSVSVCAPATGECTPPQPVVCEELECHVSRCDPATGCFLAPIPDCCTSNAQCDDGNNCTTDTCFGEDGCDNVPCEQGDECNILVDCVPDSCAPITLPVECSDDGNACTIEECVEGSGCVTFPVKCPIGTECNPGTGQCEAGGTACNTVPPGLVLNSIDHAATCPFAQLCVSLALPDCTSELIAQSRCRFGDADDACRSALSAPACTQCMLTGDSGACSSCNLQLESIARNVGCPVELEACAGGPR